MIVTEPTVSMLPPELSRWDNLLLEMAVSWIVLLIYNSILFGYIVAQTWKTRRTTPARIPLMEVVFRDGKSQSTAVSCTFNMCCRCNLLYASFWSVVPGAIGLTGWDFSVMSVSLLANILTFYVRVLLSLWRSFADRLLFPVMWSMTVVSIIVPAES
jgi:hypothetical protein